MGRRMTAYLRSFTSGLVLAGLPVAAFLVVDYIVAPPGAKTPIVSIGASNGGSPAAATDWQDVAGGVITASAPSPTTNPELTRPATLMRDTTVAGQTSVAAFSPLVRSIQSELVRVGCLGGVADGAWSDQTKIAMRAFNSSVRVDLPVDRPDYILLTLLQGHSAKACSRSCDSRQGGANACVDESIQARAIAPTERAIVAPAPVRITQAEARRRSQGAWATTTAVTDHIVEAPPVERSANLGIVAPRPRLATRPAAVVAIDVAAPTSAAANPPQVIAAAQPAKEPLPGRMAIGAALPAATAATIPAPIVAPLPAVRQVEPSRQRSARALRPAPTSARATPSGPRRLQRMFSDLATNSP